MISIYFAKTLANAHSFLQQLNLATQKRILDNKDYLKQQQMITSELLLNYAFKQAGFKENPEVLYTPKPQVLNKDIYISKTHRKKYVAVAISNNNIGLDIEEVNDSIAANKILSKEEYSNYLNNKDKLFSYYWSIKEAYIKNIGFLSNDYKDIIVDTPKQIKEINQGNILDKNYFQTFIDGYSLALVSDKPIKVKVFEVTNDVLIKEV